MNETAFVQFFHRMHPRLLGYARRHVDHETAREVASDAMTTLWRKNIDTPITDVDWQRLESLTFKITAGHVRNALRSLRQHTRREAAAAQHLLVHNPDRDTTIDTLVPLEIADLLHSLSRNDRQVLTLLLAGYTTGEMAPVLGCTPQAATMRSARARKNLHDRVARDVAEKVLCGVGSAELPDR
jgi:RNA polymerase sigma factor (sigma-70 family)